jgi:hypothetical protein
MRVAHVSGGVAIIVAGGLLASVSAQVPPGARLPRPGTPPTSSATQVISPVALVTWVARYGSDGVRVLDLLVVWRGSPGWFLRGSNRGSSGGGSGGSFYSTITYGGLDLQLGFQSETRIAEIQGKSVQLKDANIVLVDHVDTTGKLDVVATIRIDPEFPPSDGGYPPIGAMLRRSPEIVSFLRCDARLPDGRAQAMIDSICAQVLAK